MSDIYDLAKELSLKDATLVREAYNLSCEMRARQFTYGDKVGVPFKGAYRGARPDIREGVIVGFNRKTIKVKINSVEYACSPSILVTIP